jgi:hypothetical protein
MIDIPTAVKVPRMIFIAALAVAGLCGWRSIVRVRIT